MPAPKSNCSECGAEILKVTAEITGGFCMPCANRKKRDSEPRPEWMTMKNGQPVFEAPKLEPDAILQASFFPGFVTDLTSWETQVTKAGKVIQRIDWWRPESRKRSEVEIREGIASAGDVQRLEALIQELDIAGVKKMSEEACVDDAELISFLIPSLQFQETVSLYTFEFLDREHRLSDSARAGLSSFRKVWDHIESVSPYSTVEHWKED